MRTRDSAPPIEERESVSGGSGGSALGGADRTADLHGRRRKNNILSLSLSTPEVPLCSRCVLVFVGSLSEPTFDVRQIYRSCSRSYFSTNNISPPMLANRSTSPSRDACSRRRRRRNRKQKRGALRAVLAATSSL